MPAFLKKMAALLKKLAANPYVRHAVIVFAVAFTATMVGSAALKRGQLDVPALWAAVVSAGAAGGSAVLHWLIGLLTDPSTGQPVGLPWRGKASLGIGAKPR